MEHLDIRDLVAGRQWSGLDDRGIPSSRLTVVHLDGADWSATDAVGTALARSARVVIGVAERPLPPEALPFLETLTLTLAPTGPGRAWVRPAADTLSRIDAITQAAPVASVTLAGLLRVTSRAGVADGLVAESLAYSMLLAGPEFRRWRESTPRREIPPCAHPVRVHRDHDELSIVLDRPERHNAFGRDMRDSLIDALMIAELDDTVTRVALSGAGRSFCSGGDLDEFGSATDASAAHIVRLERSAGHAIHRLRDRVDVVVHGTCIGAGIEIPSFAGRVEARHGATFRLPELSMGLVPGAGGTVGITRRVGRWRTAFLALTDTPVDVSTAIEWGLVDARI